MKRIVSIAALLLAVSATAAMAQGVTKTSSTAFVPTFGSLAVAPAFTTLASLPLPSGYRSLKHTLLITVSLQENCNAGRRIYGKVTVGGVPVSPTSVNGLTECWDQEYHFMTRQYLLSPNSLGGALPDGSTVDVLASGLFGTEAINAGVVSVIMQK